MKKGQDERSEAGFLFVISPHRDHRPKGGNPAPIISKILMKKAQDERSESGF